MRKFIVIKRWTPELKLKKSVQCSFAAMGMSIPDWPPVEAMRIEIRYLVPGCMFGERVIRGSV